MPLDQATFEDDVRKILDYTTASPTVEAAGDNWGAAYAKLARTGTANGIPPVFAPSAEPTLRKAIAAAFSTLPGVPGTVAGAISAALVAFWAQATFAGAVAPPNAAALPAAFINAFAGILGAVGGTAASKAADIAGANGPFHLGTKAVTVTFPGPTIVSIT
ncbi:MAG TPA: hypothetical protein VE987_16460 [Polyangiaceae bacterium]|nr:hypothetical protein [Polyangiaceae bacterium]